MNEELVEMISVEQACSNPANMVVPLCNDCKNTNCTLNIETKRLSLFGIIVKARLVRQNDRYHVVYNCPEYVKDTNADL